MAGGWKDSMERLGRANEDARGRERRSLTLDRAARILEGLLSHPHGQPTATSDHPVSLSRRLRGKNV